MNPQPDLNAKLDATQQMLQRLMENAPHHPAMWQSLLNMAIYALAGVIVAIAGYKLFDLCTPGDLHKEIIVNKNTAAATIGAAIIVGVCLLVAASIMG
jgi:putative membrane protein